MEMENNQEENTRSRSLQQKQAARAHSMANLMNAAKHRRDGHLDGRQISSLQQIL